MNSICVASSEQMVFSGDSVGDVRVWRKEVAGEEAMEEGGRDGKIILTIMFFYIQNYGSCRESYPYTRYVHTCTWKYMCIAHQPKNFKNENKSPLTLTKQTNTNTQEQDTGCPALRTGTVG